MDGFKVDPRECGVCIPDQEYKAIFPKWATEADIDEYDKIS